MGKPLMYKTAKELQEAVDRYFKACEGEILINSEGEAVYDKSGHPVMIGQKPPTVTGLALALGFNSRQALINYQKREKFCDIVMRAKSRVEEYIESRLFDKEGLSGAKFSLSNNFWGWSGKDESDDDDDMNKKGVIVLAKIADVEADE